MKNLNYVVDLVRLDRQDTTTQNLERYLHFALLGYQALQLRASPKVNVYYFKPNSALLAPLPPDYEFYTKVGMFINGQWYTLTRNPRLSLPTNNECGIQSVDSLITDNSSLQALMSGGYGYYSYMPHFRAGQYVGEFYSLGGGWNALGYFDIDEKNFQIMLRNVPVTQFCMEYVSNGADGGNTLISMSAVFPIRQYVHWQLREHTYGNDKISLSEKMYERDKFYTEFQKYKDIVTTPTIDEYIDVMYAGFMSGPKGVAI
jgi:hypothetical protein